MARPTLYYTVGLPASGKTTYAKAMVARSKGNLREISKDDLRELAEAPQGRSRREKWVIERQDEAIRQALCEGISIVVHDTNLNPYHEKRFMRLAAEHNARLEKVDFTHVGLLECIKRDARRGKPVGENVIRSMWQQYLCVDR